MLRVLIADDHEVVRRGIRSLLETRPDFQVVAEATDGRDALEKVLSFRPDVTILDVSMPRMTGLEAIREIAKARVSTEILVLTMHASENTARDILEAGARGYMLKSDAARDLVPAVYCLARHQPFLSVAASNIVLQELRRGNGPGPKERRKLSAREIETLRLLAEGKSNKEIANNMLLSVRTVESHRASLMSKLNLHSLSELVQYAIRNNIIASFQ